MENLSAKNAFTWLDWVVMIFYMLGVLAVPAFFFWQSRKDKKFNSSKYLTAKNMKVPAIVVALSIWATALSSLTFLGTPGLAFKTGWMWVAGQLTILAITPYLVKIIVPFYRRIKGSTSYFYLQQRFNYSLRIIGSLSFILFHIFRIGIVIYIPTLTISLFVDINIYLLLFIISFIVIVGTFLGGFKGVLYTDAIQGFVLMLGIILIIIFGLAKTDFNSSTFKYHTLFTKDQWKISAAQGGIFFIFVSGYISTMFSYTASQDIVQRYKTGKTIATTYKSIYINIILVAITILLFYGAGSVLYSYYSSQGVDVDRKDAIDTIVGVEKAANNLLLSNYIIKVLPMGISGLVVAAIFAASQSTVSSSLNSLVTTFIDDILVVFIKIKEKTKLMLSYILTTAFGVLGFLVTILIAATKQQNLIEYFLGIVGLLGAPLAGIFFLAIITKRTNWIGALTGVITSFIVTLPIWILATITKTFEFQTGVYLTIISFTIVILISYLVSIITNHFFKIKQNNLTNLTIWTKSAEFKKLIKLEKKLLKISKINQDEIDYQNILNEIEKLEKIVEAQN